MHPATRQLFFWPSKSLQDTGVRPAVVVTVAASTAAAKAKVIRAAAAEGGEIDRCVAFVEESFIFVLIVIFGQQ
jgi:hypothetical protein